MSTTTQTPEEGDPPPVEAEDLEDRDREATNDPDVPKAPKQREGPAVEQPDAGEVEDEVVPPGKRVKRQDSPTKTSAEIVHDARMEHIANRAKVKARAGDIDWDGEGAQAIRAAPTQPDTDHPRSLEPLEPARRRMGVSVDLISESNTNPRKVYGDLTELAENIRRMGIAQNLLARPLGGGRFELVFGHRRLRAAKLIGLTEVPLDVLDLNDQQVLEFQLTENLERESLHPLEEAEGIGRLQALHGRTVKEIAELFGMSERWVYARTQLNRLCPEGRKAFSDKLLATDTAILISAIASPKLQAEITEKVIAPQGFEKEPMSFRAAREFMRENYTTDLRGVAFDRKDPLLVPDAGPCTTCPKRSGNNPDLFETKRADVCEDVTCFKAKLDAHWDLERQRAQRAGKKALTLTDGKKIFKNGTPSFDSPWVELDAPCPSDSKKRTWREVLGDEAIKDAAAAVTDAGEPLVHVAPDATGRAHDLMKRDDALLLAKEKELKWAKREAEQQEESKPASKEKVASDELEDRILRAVEDDVIARAVAAVEKEGESAPALRMIAFGLADRGYPAEVIARRGMDNERDLTAFIERATLHPLRGLIFELAVSEWVRGHRGFSDELHVLAKAFKINLDAVEKAQRQSQGAEGLFEKKKKPKK